MFEWRRARQGRAFWDTSAVARRAAGLSIEQLDAFFARQPPDMRELRDVPDELLMSVDEWVDVVDYAIRLVGEDPWDWARTGTEAPRRPGGCATPETSG